MKSIWRWIGSVLCCVILVAVLAVCSKARPTAAAQGTPRAGAPSVGVRIATNKGPFPCPDWVDEDHILIRHAIVCSPDESLDEAWIYGVKTKEVIKIHGEAGANLTLGWGLQRYAEDNTDVSAVMNCEGRMQVGPKADTVAMDKIVLDKQTHMLAAIMDGASGPEIVVWDTVAGRCYKIPMPKGSDAGQLRFANPFPLSPDGRRVAFCAGSEVFICDLNTGKTAWKGPLRVRGGDQVFWAADGLLVPPATVK